MEKSDRDISAWDARLKEQLERSFHNYHKRRIDLSVARENEKYDWTGETLIVEKASSATAIATVRLMFDDADELELVQDVVIKSIFNRIYLTNDAQAGAWLDVIAGINFEYKKKIAEAGGGDGINWVDRGDPAAPDWTELTLTLDGVWRDLNLSGIIDAGAKLVIFRVYEKTTDGGPLDFKMRTNGNVNETNVAQVRPEIVDKTIFATFFVSPDVNGIVEYWGQITISDLGVTVAGWFV